MLILLGKELDMSFKYQVQKISDNYYILPKMSNMKTDVHAFLSEKLYDLSEENVWIQIAEAASFEGVTGAYLMPDCHTGYTVPIGSVIVTENTMLQAGSGFDISCGIISLKVKDLYSQDIASWEKRRAFINEVEKRIAFGYGGSKNKSSYNDSDIQEILRFGAKALHVDSSLCERQYIPIPENTNLSMITKAYEKAAPQLGSVGGGNHYTELQCDEKDGSVWVQIHCGSRGYGYRVAEHFFYEGAKLRGIPTNQREKSWLRIDEPLGKEYWAYHNSAANYAIANRHIIVDGVQESLRKIFKTEGEVYYEISHNLIQEETFVLPNGTTKKGFVHRKGATRAFPAGHPDLIGTKWETTGHPCLIPGSMFDGAAILFPESGAQKSGYSVNHGSGRVMGRNEAKKKLDHKKQYLEDEMNNIKRKLGGHIVKGILGNWRHLPLDECSAVYKNLDEVLNVLEAEGIAKVAHRLYPVANLKGSD